MKVELTEKELDYLCRCVYYDYLRVKIDLDSMDLLKQCNYKLPPDKILKELKSFYENLYRKLDRTK